MSKSIKILENQSSCRLCTPPSTGRALSDTVECQIIYGKRTDVVIGRLFVVDSDAAHSRSLINALAARDRETERVSEGKRSNWEAKCSKHRLDKSRWYEMNQRLTEIETEYWIDKIEEATIATRYRFFCGHRNDIEKCNADTKGHKNCIANKRSFDWNVYVRHYLCVAFFIYHFIASIDRTGRILFCSKCTRTPLKSLIGYLMMLEEKGCWNGVRRHRMHRICPRDWNTNFWCDRMRRKLHSSHFNYLFMNGFLRPNDATFKNFRFSAIDWRKLKDKRVIA